MKIKNILFQNKEGILLANCLQPLHRDGGNVASHNSTRYLNVNQAQNNKPLPELYKLKELCCGCSACLTACPMSSISNKELVKYKFLDSSAQTEDFYYTGAISMLPDEEGFMYPTVDANMCIRCYKCLSVCPYKD